MLTRTLQLVPTGAVQSLLLKALEEPLQAQLGLSVVYGKAQQSTPAYAFNKDRKQYYCDAIMRRLVPLRSGQNLLLGVTDVDLFVPDSPFVFGEADRESKVAVVSAHRLREGGESELLKRRLQLETLRLSGHLIGLSFCEEPKCIMYLSATLADIDRKNLNLCNVCRNELAKLSR